MSYSKVTRTYDTGETAWATGFALGQLDVSHIRVRVNNEQDGLGNPVYREFTYNPDNGYVSFDPTGLVDGDKIHIERVTPINQMAVDFAGGADLTRANFDRSAKQTLMAVQELADDFEDTVTTVEELVSEVEGLLGETSAFARAVPGGAEFGRVGDVVMTTRTAGVYVGGFRIMHLHFGSRNLYETATIPVWAKNWTIVFGGRTLAYQRDDTGSAAVSANGVKCSPIEAATPAHWGVAQNTDETTKLHAMIDWCTANGHELNWPDGKTYMMSRYNNAGTNINVNWTCTGTCKLISTDTTPLGFGDPTGFEDDYFIRFAGTTVRTTQVASTTAVGSKIIPVLSTTDVVAGKHVVLINTTKMIDTDHRGQNREGFQALVTRVISGTQVEIEVPIERQITIGTTAGTITAVDSATVLTTNLVAQDVSSMRYRMRMTSGSANGQTANIVGYDPATGKITCHNENGMFPTGIVNGDTFNIEREATVLFSSAVTGSITGNLEISRPTTLNATPGDFGFRGLVLTRPLNYWIDGLRVSGFSEAGVRIISGVRGWFSNIVVQDANRAYDRFDGTGYGVSVHQSSNGVYENISGHGCRRTLDISGTQGSSWNNCTTNISGTGGGRAYDGVMFFPAGATESSVCGSHGNAFQTLYTNTSGTDVHGVLNCRGRDEVARGIHGAGAMQYLLNLFHGGGIDASDFSYDDRYSEINKTAQQQNDATTQQESRLSFVVQLDVGNWHSDRPTFIHGIRAKGVRRGLFGFRGNGLADNIHFADYDITVADNHVNFAKLRTVAGFTTTYGNVIDGGGVVRMADGSVVAGAPTRQHFNSRAEFIASSIPAWQDYWSIAHAGVVVHYKRDASGTAITSANGVKGSPAFGASVKHWNVLGDGIADDVAQINAAIAWCAATATHRLHLPSPGRYLVDSADLNILRKVHLYGDHSYTDMTDRAYWNTVGSCIVLNPARTIKLYNGAAAVGMVVMPTGLTIGAAGLTAEQLAAFSGTAFTPMSAASYIGHTTIMGFEWPFKSPGLTNSPRHRMDHVHTDCTNGVHVENDLGGVNFYDVQAHPFTTNSDALNVRTGIGMKFKNKSDWSWVVSCFNHGYQVGYDVEDSNSINFIACGADHPNPLVGVTAIGFRFTGTSTENRMVGCQSASKHTGIDVRLTDVSKVLHVRDFNFWNGQQRGMYIESGKVEYSNGHMRGIVAAVGTPTGIVLNGAQAALKLSGSVFRNMGIGVGASSYNYVDISDDNQFESMSVRAVNGITAPVLASAGTVTLPSYSDVFNISGTTAITTLVGAARVQGQEVTLTAQSRLPLTHGASLVLHGERSRVLAPGDSVRLVYVSGNEWRERTSVGTPTKNRITCWGDSMTRGATDRSYGYPETLATLLGRPVNNLGIGGDSVLKMAMRAGQFPINIQLTSGVMPASGGVSITRQYDLEHNILMEGTVPKSTWFFTTVFWGIPGTVSTDGSGNWTFTRTTAGVTQTLGTAFQQVLVTGPGGSSLFPDPQTLQSDVVIIWGGRNGGWEDHARRRTVRDRTLLIANSLLPQHRRFLVLPVFNGRAKALTTQQVLEPSGSSAYANIAELNRNLKTQYGGHFVDGLREYMVRDAIYDAGLTPTADDLADIASDCIPRQLMFDNVHLTETGYTQLATFLASVIKSRGW